MLNNRETRLSLFCRHVIEGGWLVALVVAPLFFNVYSSRIFDPDKAAVVRTIGLVMVLAWIIRGLELRRADSGIRKEHADPAVLTFGWLKRLSIETTFVLPLVLLFLIDRAFATAISISPSVSLWGSYPRLQGLYTTAAYVLIFISIVVWMRSREQVDRLITTVLVVSLPVALYGIIQYFGTDPLAWGSDVTERVASSMGNPLFVAAFLIMAVPLALFRLLWAGAMASEKETVTTTRVLVLGGVASLAFQMVAWREGPLAGTASAAITVATWLVVAWVLRKPLALFLQISTYTVLLSTQLMCLLFSQSRGPWLGLIAGIFLFALLWTSVRRRRRLGFFVVGGGLAAAVLLVAINIPQSPLGFVRSVPYIGRIGLLSNVESGSARVRVLIWEGVESLLAEDPLRTFAGYGPETLYVVYPPHYPPELGRLQERDTLPDRAHNETFDVLITTGIPGLIIYLLFFTSLFFHALSWVGMVPTKFARNFLLSLWFGGGLTAVLLVRFLDNSWRFAGLALPIGLLSGLFVFVCLHTVSHREITRPDLGDQSMRLIGVTILAALVAHFFEIQLGLAVTATQTYFWAFAGVLIACPYIRIRQTDSTPQPVPGPLKDLAHSSSPNVQGTDDVGRYNRRIALQAGSLVAGCILVTLMYDFPVLDRVADFGWSVAWLLVFTWVTTGIILITEILPSHGTRTDAPLLGRSVAIYVAISVSIPLAFAGVRYGMLRLDAGVANLVVIYFTAIVIMIVLFGGVSMRARSGPGRRWSRTHGSVYIFMAAGTLFVAYRTNVNPIRADVYFKEAYQRGAVGRYDESARLYRKAISLAPNQDVYYRSFGKTLMERAAFSADPASLFEDTERLLSKARTLSPLSPNHTANLARLYRAWAEHTENERLRRTRFRRALDLFEQATRLGPQSASLWNDLGDTYVLEGDTASALGVYHRSLALDQEYYETHFRLGNLYFAQKRWKDAASAYQTVLELESGHRLARLALAAAKAKMGPSDNDD